MQTGKISFGQFKVAALGFLSLFSLVGIMFYGFPSIMISGTGLWLVTGYGHIGIHPGQAS